MTLALHNFDLVLQDDAKVYFSADDKYEAVVSKLMQNAADTSTLGPTVIASPHLLEDSPMNGGIWKKDIQLKGMRFR